MYHVYNNILRDIESCGEVSSTANRYPTTIQLIVSGIRKLCTIAKMPEGGAVFRGLSGLALPHKFFKPDEQGCVHRAAAGLEQALGASSGGFGASSGGMFDAVATVTQVAPICPQWAGQIFIQRAGRRTFVLNVTSDDTVASVKARLKWRDSRLVPLAWGAPAPWGLTVSARRTHCCTAGGWAGGRLVRRRPRMRWRRGTPSSAWTP